MPTTNDSSTPPEPEEQEASNQDVSSSSSPGWLKRAAKIALKIFVGLLVLLGVVVAFTQTNYFQNLLREQIEASVNNALAGSIEIGEIDGNLFTGVTVHRVRVYDQHGLLAVSVDEANADYDLLKLLDYELVITELNLIRPVGIMRYDREGNLNLVQLVKPSDAPSDPNAAQLGISAADVHVTHGSLLYINEAGFAEVRSARADASYDAITKILADTELLTSDGLYRAHVSKVLRETPDLSSDDIPVLAMVSDLDLQANLTLNKEQDILVQLDPFTALLDANTWAQKQDFSLARLETAYSSQAIKVNLSELHISRPGEVADPNGKPGHSQIQSLDLSVELIPAQKDTEQLPYPSAMSLELKQFVLTRELLNQVLPGLAVRDGFQIEQANIAGSPAALTAKLQLDALSSGAQIKFEATTKEVVSNLLEGMDLPPSAPKPAEGVTPNYQIDLSISKLDPAALYADLPTANINTRLAIRGEGLDPSGKELQANVLVHIDPSTIYEWKIQQGILDLVYEDRALKVRQGELDTPYADASLTGEAIWPGEVDLKLEVKTDKEHDRAITLPQGAGQFSQQRIDLTAALTASADASQEDIVQSLTKLSLDATWALEGLAQQDTFSLTKSNGSLDVDLSEPSSSTPSAPRRLITARVDMSASGVSSPPADIALDRVKVRGNTRVTTPWLPKDPMALRDAILSDLDIDLSGLRAQGIAIGALDATVTTSPLQGSGKLDYTLDVRSLRNLSYPSMGVRLGSLKTNLSGRIGLSSQGELDYLAAQGSGDLSKLRYQEQTVERAEFTVNVAGRPPLLRGDVKLDSEDLVLGGQALEDASVTASIADNGDFSLDASVVTDPKTQRALDLIDQPAIAQVSEDTKSELSKPQRLRVTATGNISDSLDEIRDLNADIYNLNQDANEPIWSIDDADITTRGGKIQVENLTLRNDDQLISIDGTYRERGEQDLKVSAKNVKIGQLIEELALQDLAPDIEGTVERVDFTLSGTAKEPEITIDILIKDFYYQRIGPFDLVLKGRYENDRLTINTLDLDGYEMDLLRGQARVPMRLDLQGNTTFFWTENILLTFFIDPIDLDRFTSRLSTLKTYKLDGTISGGGILNGTLRDPVLDVNVNAKDVSFDGTISNQEIELTNISFMSRLQYEPPEKAQGGFIFDASLSRDTRQIASIQSSSPIPVADWIYETLERKKEIDFASEVTSQPFTFKTLFKDLRLQELSEAGLTQDLDLRGVFNLDIDATGTFAEPTVAMTSNLDGFSIKGPIAGQKLDIQGVAMTSTLNLDGALGSLDPLKLRVNLDWDDHRLLDMAAEMAVPLNSWLTKLSRGAELDAFTELQTIPFEIDAKLDRLDLSKLAVAPLLKQSDAAGVISLNFDAAGTMRDPQGKISLDVGEMVCKSDPTQEKPCNGFGWDRYRDIVVDANLRIKDKLLTLENFDLNWDDTDIASATGSLPLPLDTLLDGAPLEDVDYDFLLKMYPVPLNKLSAVDYTFASLTGALKGAVKLSGSLRKPEVESCIALLDAKLGKDRVSVGSIGLDITSREQSASASLKLCKNKVTANARRDYTNICSLAEQQVPTCEEGDVLVFADAAARINTDLIALSKGADPLLPTAAATTQGNLKAGDDLFVSVHTRDNKPLALEEILPMNILKRFATNIEGTLAMDIDVQGTYEAPVPTGEFQLRNAGLTIPDLGRRFDKIFLGATMDQSTIKLEKLSISEGDTNIALLGKLNHDKLSPTTLQGDLKSNRFDVGTFVGFPFFATSDMSFNGDLSKDPMQMTVNVEQLDVQLTEDISSDLHPTELDGDIIVLNRNADGSIMIDGEVTSATTEQGNDANSMLSSLALSTRVIMSRDCWVHHPYGEVNLTGDFTAAVRGTNVVMSGEVEAIRGQAEFLGKIFRVERALVTFTGADPPNPRLQIEAAYELDQNIVAALGPASDGRPRIMVLIEGSAYEPILKLRSDPPMSETDIIYVLATNRPPGTAGVGQDSSVAAAALSAASGLLVGMLKDELSDNLPLDFFDVLNVDTSNFEVGKYVYNGKIYLSYRYLFGNSNGNSSIYQFDYHFFPRWTLEAQGSNGESGGELNLNVFWDAF